MATTQIIVPSARRHPAPTVEPPPGCSVLLPDGEQATVQAYVNQYVRDAAGGAVLCIPAGSWTWHTGTGTNNYAVVSDSGKSFILKGAGKTQTHILWDPYPSLANSTPPEPVQANPNFIGIMHVKTDDYFRLSGIHFTHPVTGGRLVKGNSHFLIAGYGTRVRIDNIHFDKLYNTNNQYHLINFVDCLGVVDQCTIEYAPVLPGVSPAQNYDCFFTTQHPVLFDVLAGITPLRDQGHGSWDAATGWGTSNFLFMENNTYISPTGGQSAHGNDCIEGGRYVIRYNQVGAMNFGGHGTETGAERGCRAKEVYKNHFSGKPPSDSLTCRAGTALFYENEGTNIASGWGPGLHTYRRYDDLGGFGFCDGSGPTVTTVDNVSSGAANPYGFTGLWDRHGSLQAFGTHTGPDASEGVLRDDNLITPWTAGASGACTTGGGQWGACKYAVKMIDVPAATLTPSALKGTARKFIASAPVFKPHDDGAAIVITGGPNAGSHASITDYGWRPAGTVTPTASTGVGVAFNASSATAFELADVGRQIQVVAGSVSPGGIALITAIPDAQHAVATIVTDFVHPNVAIAANNWKVAGALADTRVKADIRWKNFVDLSPNAVGTWNLQWGVKIFWNGTNTLTFPVTSSQGARTFKFDTGERYEIWGPFDSHGAACIDYSGAGQTHVALSGTGTLATPTGTGFTPQQWPLNDHEPIYLWSNLLDGELVNECDEGDGLQHNTGGSCVNRGTEPLPGYIPYTYPHPLRTTGPVSGDNAPWPW